MTHYLFEVKTPLGFLVRCTKSYWLFIVSEKHPVLQGHENDIQKVLSDPDEIRKSKRDPNVYLFYRGSKPRWLCAVIKSENNFGFLITAYPTDSIKVGQSVWKKSK
ncbi:MAG: DUF4258 domain-containing protein [Deltaproteobacteria bacterium]|nr:DUF4258 domain-containing protein [Deltaproteobacteria bacterium]